MGPTPDTRSLEELKSIVIPALFAEPSRIGEYGPKSGGATLEAVADLLEQGSVSLLAAKISEIINGLSDADPRVLTKEASWLDRVLGRNIERQVRYQVARKSLDALLDETAVVAERTRKTLRTVEDLLKAHQAEVMTLQTYITAGEEYLTEHPDAGITTKAMMKEGALELEFDRPRERFTRKLANLNALLTSHQLSISQLALARAQTIDLLDRYQETATILLPVWRQHTLTLLTTQHMSPEMVAKATKAHEALTASLQQSLSGINQQ